MATNPLVAQGTLNRLRGSVIWNAFPELNVTAPFLGQDGIGLALDGASTVFLPTMTGAVTSQEPYMMVTLTLALLKTQGLSDAYKTKMEANAQLGDGIVRPDAVALSPYPLINCSIQGVGNQRYNGSEAVYPVTVQGYYLVNSNLFDA